MLKNDQTPNGSCDQFFKDFMSHQFPLCYQRLSNKSREHFLKWTLDTIYKRHKEAAEFAQLTTKEIDLMFKKGDAHVTKLFWVHFYRSSSCGDVRKFGYYSVQSHQGNRATVLITLRFPNGQEQSKTIEMFKEGGGWRVGYAESKWPL
jgi:hypothetical protein